ncbi:MAG: methyl-accepting chemotaxis protein, partial [Granulosicoccaceae bacterium]
MKTLSQLFQNTSISMRIAILLAVPVLSLLYFSITEIQHQRGTMSDLHRLQQLSELATTGSALVHETQKERGRTAGYYGKRSVQNKSSLDKQRQAMDKRHLALKTFVSQMDEMEDEVIQKTLAQTMSALARIERVRQQVDNNAISANDAIAYYTDINNQFIDLVTYMPHMTGNAKLALDMTAYAHFLASKERAGIERAILNKTFAAGSFAPGHFEKFIALVAQQDAYMHAFEKVATAEHEKLYQDTLVGPAIEEVNRLRQIAKDNSSTGNFGVQADHWFSTITKKINLLKQVEDQIAHDLERDSELMLSHATFNTYKLIALSTLSLLACLVLWWILAHYVSDSLNKAIDVLQRLAQSDLSARMEDVFGQMANALNAALDNLEQLIAKIGQSANTLAKASSEIDNSSSSISGSTQGQASRLESTASAMREITATIQNSA